MARDLIFREDQNETTKEKRTCSWWLTESQTGTVGRERDRELKMYRRAGMPD